MLRDQIAGRNDSWAIRWHASCYLAGMLTLYPGRSLVHNLGNDGSGTHADARDDFSQMVAQEPIVVERVRIAASQSGRDAFVRFFRSHQAPRWKRVLRAMRRLRRAAS